MEYIREKYKQFIKGHEDDEDWIYDMTHEFICTLSNGDMCRIMDFVLRNEKK